MMSKIFSLRFFDPHPQGSDLGGVVVVCDQLSFYLADLLLQRS